MEQTAFYADASDDSRRSLGVFRRLEGLSYDDVLLVPKLGVLKHRSEADISGEWLPGHRIQVPIVSAPMSSVTDGRMAMALFQAGARGIVHRDWSIDQQLAHYRVWPEQVQAIGLDIERYTTLLQAGCYQFCLDLAHAHHEQVYDFIRDLPLIDEIDLIVGNIATAPGARFLLDIQTKKNRYAVSTLKVGIGAGAACSTRRVTGFGFPQLSAIFEVNVERNRWLRGRRRSSAPIIADGGIENSGDIVKALAAGADTVMLGHLLAGCDEAPCPGQYFGMASKRVNGHRAPEGVESDDVPSTGPVEDVIKSLAWGIRSGVSYAGARNLEELRQNAEWVRVAPGVHRESSVRV